MYKITHLGVLKYALEMDLNTDKNSNILNASLESTILNDINSFNNSSDLILILKGEPYKLVKNVIYNN